MSLPSRPGFYLAKLGPIKQRGSYRLNNFSFHLNIEINQECWWIVWWWMYTCQRPFHSCFLYYRETGGHAMTQWLMSGFFISAFEIFFPIEATNICVLDARSINQHKVCRSVTTAIVWIICLMSTKLEIFKNLPPPFKVLYWGERTSRVQMNSGASVLTSLTFKNDNFFVRKEMW